MHLLQISNCFFWGGTFNHWDHMFKTPRLRLLCRTLDLRLRPVGSEVKTFKGTFTAQLVVTVDQPGDFGTRPPAQRC